MKKTIQCNAINRFGKRCNKMTKDLEKGKCVVHKNSILPFEKPSECPVCFDSLDNQELSLYCGHWVHISCIEKSFKAECPICRYDLTKYLSNESLKKIGENKNQVDNSEIEDYLRSLLRDYIQDNPFLQMIIDNEYSIVPYDGETDDENSIFISIGTYN